MTCAAIAKKCTRDLPLHLLDFNQTEAGLVDQRCGLKRVAATLVAQVTPRDSAQLIAHKRQQLVECRSLAAAPHQQQRGGIPEIGRNAPILHPGGGDFRRSP